MGLVRAGARAGVLVGETGKDLGPGTAEVTKRKSSGDNNGHELLKGSAGPFKGFSTGDLLQRDDGTKTGMVRFLAGVGNKRGEATGSRTIHVPPENKTLRSELVVVEEHFFLTVE